MFGYLVLKRPSLKRRQPGSRDRPLQRLKPGVSSTSNLLPQSVESLRDVNGSGSKPAHISKKLSLQCLVQSVLNFERGRRRASRVREDDLLQSAENGDLAKVKRLVDHEGSININCTDPLGRTPIHLAVANEQKEVVNFLLGHVDKKCVYQALMLAINLGHDEIAEMIIEHKKYEEISTEIKTDGAAQFFLNTFGDDNQFSEEITPLILAAQQNRFEIVMALLMKDEKIQKPHKYLCACEECVKMSQCDELKFAKARLNTYKGLASEAYISLSSEDPVLTSFELRKELRHVANDEKYYTSEYSAIAEQLSDYVVRLLDKVHGNEELNAILNAQYNNSLYDDSVTLPRLQLAIEYKEKKFVAHPSCQKKLTSMWYANYFNTSLQTRSFVFKAAFVTLIILLYPFIAVWYIAWPKSKLVGEILRTPVVKFVAQAVSFTFFLGLILTHSYVEQNKLCSTKFLNDSDIHKQWTRYRSRLNKTSLYFLDKMCVRNNTPGILEVLVIIWITGLLWQECKQVYNCGFRIHFMDVYNHVDFFMLKLYIASITLRQLQHLMVYSAIDYFRHDASWEKLLGNSEEAHYKLYVLNADRYYWDAWDPYHMCEALFAVGNILNFTRLFYLLAISEHLGPMLITLERMLKDMIKFMVTFICIMYAFMVGMYNLYWYYDPQVREKVEYEDHNVHTRAELAFGSLELTFRSVFWALFGLKDPRLVELQDRKIEGRGFSTKLTESVGYIIFGTYHWGAVIILLNMLIAMMTRSFEKIAIHQDIEWKFARSKLYMEYIEQGSTLPVPFNLMPSIKTLTHIIKVCYKWCNCKERYSKRRELLIQMSQTTQDDIEASTATGCETTYVINNDATSHRPSPLPSPIPSHRSWANYSLRTSENDYKTVIKRVVRRYIFEHLQATVGSESNNEQQGSESIKHEFENVNSEINSLKPKVQAEFEKLRAGFGEQRQDVNNLKTSMNNIQEQLKTITEMLQNLNSSQKTSSSSHLTQVKDNELKNPSNGTKEDCKINAFSYSNHKSSLQAPHKTSLPENNDILTVNNSHNECDILTTSNCANECDILTNSNCHNECDIVTTSNCDNECNAVLSSNSSQNITCKDLPEFIVTSDNCQLHKRTFSEQKDLLQNISNDPICSLPIIFSEPALFPSSNSQHDTSGKANHTPFKNRSQSQKSPKKCVKTTTLSNSAETVSETSFNKCVGKEEEKVDCYESSL